MGTFVNVMAILFATGCVGFGVIHTWNLHQKGNSTPLVVLLASVGLAIISILVTVWTA